MASDDLRPDVTKHCPAGEGLLVCLQHVDSVGWFADLGGDLLHLCDGWTRPRYEGCTLPRGVFWPWRASEPSAADFFAFFVCLLVTKKTGPIPSEFPKFAAWMETMRALPTSVKLLNNGVPIFP